MLLHVFRFHRIIDSYVLEWKVKGFWVHWFEIAEGINKVLISGFSFAFPTATNTI